MSYIVRDLLIPKIKQMLFSFLSASVYNSRVDFCSFYSLLYQASIRGSEYRFYFEVLGVER